MKSASIAAILLLAAGAFAFSDKQKEENTWIRINFLGYQPSGIKVAVWCSKENHLIRTFQLVDAVTKKTVFTGSAGKAFGAYGPFVQTYRLNFSSFKKPGKYFLRAGNTQSAEFTISENVYEGTADFCLRYMRQQRTGFNPFLKDSCHTHDGYVLYGEKAGIKDSTRIDVVGGWHDASDYLQYSTTSANATYHLLAAYRDFPGVFTDEKQANGLDGKNGTADVLDEARWGLDWMLKMHPRPDWMFNQIADDRDHMGMRIPKQDTFYGRGFERPVYFINGEPQQRGKFTNNTKGTSSTAAKFASAFALGAAIFGEEDSRYAERLREKAITARFYSTKKYGVTQTASVKAPYIYAEDNWVDDMELAYAASHQLYASGPAKDIDATSLRVLLDSAYQMAKQETITPWLGGDTAHHYQWYPFINLGHYELAKQLKGKQKDTIIGYYREGIRRVWNKAKENAFYRGIPFIWCSNNLTTAFAIQCYWYKQLTGDKQFNELEQANFDWLFGCNPWGTSMVYGLPSGADTPVDPHSAFTHLGNYPIDGGLVDGPVYTSIYKSLIGIKLYEPDEYAPFQSDLAVYHDDYGDYSTNEPTMDGTASLIYLLAAKEAEFQPKKRLPRKGVTISRGAIIRGDSTKKKMALVFTGHEYAGGASFIAKTLREEKIKASFFLTGDFYKRHATVYAVNLFLRDGHFLGNHSNTHLLCCDWNKRDSLLIDKPTFLSELLEPMDMLKDLEKRQQELGYAAKQVNYFLPAYEWHNDSIAAWCREAGIQLVNMTPGTLSHADYTVPGAKNYRSSDEIYQSIVDYEKRSPSGLNGFILLMHVGTDPAREDKFYHRLPGLIAWLKNKNYELVNIDQLLRN